MSAHLIAQATAASRVRARRHMIEIIVCCLREIRSHDHLLAQLTPALTPEAAREIAAATEAQAGRLADALTDLRTISDLVRYEPDPHCPGSLREIPDHSPSHHNETPHHP